MSSSINIPGSSGADGESKEECCVREFCEILARRMHDRIARCLSPSPMDEAHLAHFKKKLWEENFFSNKKQSHRKDHQEAVLLFTMDMW
jgi:hypothetical protein